MSWAKLPSAWLRPRGADPDPESVKADLTPEPSVRDLSNYPLASLMWRKDGSSSMAALMVLIALAIRRNQSHKGREFDKGALQLHKVAVTYSDLQRMTGFARASVGTGLDLLEGLGAISREKVGRSNVYELMGVDKPGGWCQLPQSELLRGDGTLSIKPMERKRATLHALKVYMALLALRNQKLNVTSLSYSGIMKWTGLRRADVGAALHVLITWELIHVSEEFDDANMAQERRRKRYRIKGLVAVHHHSETTAAA
jgi:hypothetical protein